MEKIILIDVDDVTCDLLTEWLRRYNEKYEDSLTKEDIKTWDMTKYVKCGKDIYDFLRDVDLYECVTLMPGIFEAVIQLKSLGFRVIFASSGLHIGKQDFLFRHKLIDHPRDFITISDKYLIDSVFLIDDGVHNIQAYNEKRGIGILFDAVHNRDFEYPYRAYTWIDAVNWVCKFEGVYSLFGG